MDSVMAWSRRKKPLPESDILIVLLIGVQKLFKNCDVAIKLSTEWEECPNSSIQDFDRVYPTLEDQFGPEGWGRKDPVVL